MRDGSNARLHVWVGPMNCLAFKAPEIRSKDVGGDTNVAFSDRAVGEISNGGFGELSVTGVHNDVLHLTCILGTFEVSSGVVLSLTGDGAD